MPKASTAFSWGLQCVAEEIEGSGPEPTRVRPGPRGPEPLRACLELGTAGAPGSLGSLDSGLWAEGPSQSKKWAKTRGPHP